MVPIEGIKSGIINCFQILYILPKILKSEIKNMGIR